jgi:zinc transporter 5/7
MSRDGTVLLHCTALLALTPWEVSLHSLLHVVLVLCRALGYLAMHEKQVALHHARSVPRGGALLVGARVAANLRRLRTAAGARTAAAFTRTMTALRSIASHSATRGLFWFLMLNVACMVAEAVVGAASDSLSLLSDAAHMASDNVSVFIGLCAAYYATVPGNDAQRAAQGERAAGFVNALLLLLSAVWIAGTAVHRLQYPRPMHGALLLPVAILGLLVNLFGLFVFQGHGHSHGGGHSHGHGHSHGGQCSSSAHEENMHSIYLHVAADTLGSASVLVSFALARLFGWLWADPVCSLAVAALIAASVTPVLRRTGAALLTSKPAPAASKPFELPEGAAHDVMCVPGVHRVTAAAAGESLTVDVQVHATCSSPADVRGEVQRTLRLHGLLGATVVVHTGKPLAA